MTRARTIGRFRPSRFIVIIGLIALAGFGIRVAAIVHESSLVLGGDAKYYHEAANLLADGKGFIDPVRYEHGWNETITLPSGEQRTIIIEPGHEEPTAGHPPVYAMYLGAVSSLGLRTVREHQIASALLGSVSIVLAGLLGRRLRSERLGIIAAVITAVYANIWINDVIVMSETAAIAAAFLATLLGVRFWTSPTLRNGVYFAIGGALAALSRAELVLYLPIIAAVALLRSPLPWGRRFASLAMMGLTCLAIISPWVIRNNLVMKEFVTLSDGAGTVAVQANCDDTYYGDNIGSWSIHCGDPQPYGPNGELLDESQRDVVVRQRALDYMKAHSGRLIAAVIPARLGRMWGFRDPITQIRIDVIERRPALPAWIGFWQYVVLVPAALAGLVVQWRRKQPVLVVALWAVLATFTAATTFGNTRYRTAAEVSIVILASIAFDALWGLLRRRRAGTGGAEHIDVAVVAP